MNISPVRGYTLAVCRSMQNIQVIKGWSGFVKYVWKYMEKFYKKIYAFIEIYGKEKLVTKAVLLKK